MDYSFRSLNAITFVLHVGRDRVCWSFSFQVRVTYTHQPRQLACSLNVGTTISFTQESLECMHIVHKFSVFNIWPATDLYVFLPVSLVSGKAINLFFRNQTCSLFACCNLNPLTFKVRPQKLKQLRYLYKVVGCFLTGGDHIPT